MPLEKKKQSPNASPNVLAGWGTSVIPVPRPRGPGRWISCEHETSWSYTVRTWPPNKTNKRSKNTQAKEKLSGKGHLSAQCSVLRLRPPPKRRVLHKQDTTSLLADTVLTRHTGKGKKQTQFSEFLQAFYTNPTGREHVLFNFFKRFIFMWMSICLHLCMCTKCM